MQQLSQVDPRQRVPPVEPGRQARSEDAPVVTASKVLELMGEDQLQSPPVPGGCRLRQQHDVRERDGRGQITVETQLRRTVRCDALTTLLGNFDEVGRRRQRALQEARQQSSRHDIASPEHHRADHPDEQEQLHCTAGAGYQRQSGRPGFTLRAGARRSSRTNRRARGGGRLQIQHGGHRLGQPAFAGRARASDARSARGRAAWWHRDLPLLHRQLERSKHQGANQHQLVQQAPCDASTCQPAHQERHSEEEHARAGHVDQDGGESVHDSAFLARSIRRSSSSASSSVSRPPSGPRSAAAARLGEPRKNTSTMCSSAVWLACSSGTVGS